MFPSCQVGTNDLSASWAGGDKGREVLDRLLPKISHLLSPCGIFYLVAIKENNIGKVKFKTRGKPEIGELENILCTFISEATILVHVHVYETDIHTTIGVARTPAPDASLYFFPGLFFIIFSYSCSFMVVWGFGRILGFGLGF